MVFWSYPIWQIKNILFAQMNPSTYIWTKLSVSFLKSLARQYFYQNYDWSLLAVDFYNQVFGHWIIEKLQFSSNFTMDLTCMNKEEILKKKNEQRMQNFLSSTLVCIKILHGKFCYFSCKYDSATTLTKFKDLCWISWWYETDLF